MCFMEVTLYDDSLTFKCVGSTMNILSCEPQLHWNFAKLGSSFSTFLISFFLYRSHAVLFCHIHHFLVFEQYSICDLISALWRISSYYSENYFLALNRYLWVRRGQLVYKVIAVYWAILVFKINQFAGAILRFLTILSVINYININWYKIVRKHLIYFCANWHDSNIFPYLWKEYWYDGEFKENFEIQYASIKPNPRSQRFHLGFPCKN